MDLKSGDKLEVIKPFTTLAGKYYTSGMELELLEPTGQNPFSVDTTSLWLVKCPFFQPPDKQSVWGCIEGAIQIGLLRRLS
jgi:hypothetical protein